ncbi:hypothetical protein ARSEF1564_003927 [Beauveria bassiana]
MAYPIDTASLDLIAKLQLEDAESLLKGKHAAGTQPDAEYAAQLLRDELEQIRISIADNAMCRSIAAAVLADSDAIQSSLGEEQQAIRDREYAAHLDSMNLDSDDVDLANVLPHKSSSEPHIDDEMIGKLAILFVDDGELPGHASYAVRGESSAQGARAGRYDTRHCVSCEEDVSYIDSLVAVVLNSVMFAEKSGKLVVIEIWTENWMMRNEQFEWNKSSRTCETTTNVDMRPGELSQVPFSARNA